MIDHGDHETGACGHPHPPNPYVDSDRAMAMHHLVIHLHRMAILTVGLDPQLTAQHAALSVISANGGRDIGDTARALLWELADMVNVLASGKEPQTERHPSQADDDAEDEESWFNFHVLDAYFTAAATGRIRDAVNVADALVAEAPRFLSGGADDDPDRFVVQMFANALTSSSWSLRAQLGDDPMLIFQGI